MDQRKLRKYEHSLVISGGGIILFGAWSIAKAAIFFLITPMDKMDSAITADMREGSQQLNLSDAGITYVYIAVILLVLLVSLLIRLFIGRAAIQDGRRIRRRRPVYIVLSAVIGVGLIMGIIARFAFQGGQTTGAETLMHMTAVSVFVDATSLLCVVELIVSAIMVRRLRREAE